MQISSIREKLWLQVGEKKDGSLPSSWFNTFFAFLIIFSIVLVVIGTEFTPGSIAEKITNTFENSIGVIFVIEYLIRGFVSPLSKRYGKGLKGILRYLLTPSSIIDLIAIAPIFLGIVGSEIYLVRIIRLARIFRLGKVGKFQNAFGHIIYAIFSRIEELKIIGLYTSVLTLISSTLLYFAEGKIQPEAFGTIPKAMWWSIITITTVGYGDTYPISTLGRIITAITALAGISVIAIAAGLISSGFDEAIQNSRNQRSKKSDWIWL